MRHMPQLYLWIIMVINVRLRLIARAAVEFRADYVAEFVGFEVASMLYPNLILLNLRIVTPLQILRMLIQLELVVQLVVLGGGFAFEEPIIQLTDSLNIRELYFFLVKCIF